MTRWLRGILCALVITITGCEVSSGRSSPPTSRETFELRVESVHHALGRLLDLGAAGLFAHLWLDLDPAQQALTSQDLFVRCETEIWRAYRGAAYEVVTDVKPVTFTTTWTVPGTDVVRDTVFVANVRLEFPQRGGVGKPVFLSNVDGTWRWMLDGFIVEDYRAGRCSDGGVRAL